MPSGPPELHEKWTKAGPTDAGDANAIQFLEGRGYKLTHRWTWVRPKPEHEPTEDEGEAMDYLIWEWDFGGLDDCWTV